MQFFAESADGITREHGTWEIDAGRFWKVASQKIFLQKVYSDWCKFLSYFYKCGNNFHRSDPATSQAVQEKRSEWAMEDSYLFPGPTQYSNDENLSPPHIIE